MALVITVAINDADEQCLKNDILDIDEWVQNAVIGKINNCKKRLIREWQPKLMADPSVTTMPADEAKFIAEIMKRSDFKNRLSRESLA